MFGRLEKLSSWRGGGNVWCALRCEMRCGQERMCLTVGVCRCHRDYMTEEKVREEVRVCEARETDFMASVRLVR